MDPSTELRKQRDAIRHEMEQLVRTMQRLEPDVDQKKPGWEHKRDELAQHRQRLSELRGKMRAVMDAAASGQHRSDPGAGSSSYTPGNTRPPTVLFTPGQSAPSGHQQQLSPLRRSVSPVRDASPPRGSLSGTSGSHQLQELVAMHRSEKQRLAEEVARATEAMDRRHAQERAELDARLQQEEVHLREYEMARQRMEDAQRHLEALKKLPTAPTNRSSLPELEMFGRR